MEYSYAEKKIGSAFILVLGEEITEKITFHSKFLKFFWNRGSEDVIIKVNHIPVSLKTNQIACTTYNQEVKIVSPIEAVTALFFNREF